MEFIYNHILSLLIFIPIIFGAIIAILPLNDKGGKALAFLSLLIVFILGIFLCLGFNTLLPLNFLTTVPLIPAFGVSFTLATGGISFVVALIIAFLTPLAYFILATDKKGYYACILFAQGVFFLTIFAKDMIVFYAGWEAMLLPLFIMIGRYGKREERAKASLGMMYYMMFGSMLMLFAILFLGAAYHAEFGSYSFAVADLQRVTLTPLVSLLLFCAFMLAFCTKLPIFPFHMWMPAAYVSAPAGVTFMLSAITSKIAIYAIACLMGVLFPVEFAGTKDIFIYIGVFSMVYFAIAIFREDNLKRLISYSSASHLGLMLAGVFTLSEYGMSGSVYQMLSHAMATGVLFLLAGLIYKQTKTYNINSLGGIALKAPILAVFFAIAMFSSVGLPSTNGFIGEFLILLGLFSSNPFAGILAVLSVILGAVYMLRAYKKAILLKQGKNTANFKDLSLRQTCIFAPILAFIIILGLYTEPLLGHIKPTVVTELSIIMKELK